MESILENQRVVIVGPSRSILDQDLGNYIDSFDLVVRMNSGYPIPQELSKYIGTRTDVYFHNGEDSHHKHVKQKMKDQICLTELKCLLYDSKYTHKSMVSYYKNQHIPFYNYRPYWNSLNAQLKCQCNTGTVAIYKLLSHNIKELFICGMTFMQEPYYRQYPKNGQKPHLWHNGVPKNIGIHAVKPQLNWFLKQLQDDKRIHVDPLFQHMINRLNYKNQIITNSKIY